MRSSPDTCTTTFNAHVAGQDMHFRIFSYMCAASTSAPAQHDRYYSTVGRAKFLKYKAASSCECNASRRAFQHYSTAAACVISPGIGSMFSHSLTLKYAMYTSRKRNCSQVEMDDARAAPTYPMPVPRVNVRVFV